MLLALVSTDMRRCRQGKALVTAAGLHSPEARKLFMKA